jgi:hypothetical protein
VLVVIDDAHQADTSSLRLLAELAPALRAMPAAVLVTARDGDQAWQGRLDERSALLRSGLVITLPPFAEGDVAGLTGAPPAPDLVRVIAERSGGNPLLVVELARQVSRQGSGDAAAARVVVPEPVRVITHSRLAELSVPARSVLKADAPVSLDEPEIEGLYAELDDYTVAFETHKDDVDPAPFFRGLPDDRCQCPHWGVVLSGRIIFRYPGYDEVYTAGDAYHAVPGHLPLLFAGTELVEFSPTGPLAESMAVIGKNLQAREA